jgi:phage-related protein
MAQRSAARAPNTRTSTTRPRATARRAPNAKELATFASATVMPVRLSANFAQTMAVSKVQGLKLATDTVASVKPLSLKVVETSELVHWASASNDPENRRTLVKAFKNTGSEMMLIQHMTELPREQTAVFMKDFFAAGGSTASVAEWLRAVGTALRELRQPKVRSAAKKATRTARTTVASKKTARGASRGWFDDVVNWVKDTAKKVGNAITDVVGSVVDAVISAGKSIANAVKDAINWTMDQIGDLVEALIKAGKRVADILTAAVANGVAVLQKYVQAVIEAGKQVADVLSWAASQVAATVNAVVSKLIALGKSVLDVVRSAVNLVSGALLNVVKALLAAGKKVFDILNALAAEALSTVQSVVNALIAAGQTLKAILTEAAKLVVAAARNVVKALINLGKTVAQILSEAVTLVVASVNAIVKALIDLGHTVVQLISAVASAAAAVVQGVLKALLALGKTVADIVLAAVSQAVSVCVAVFKALMVLGKKVTELITTLAGRALSAIRTALEALFSMGIALADVVKNVVLDVAEGFRRGFFEGLLALGKGALQILKAAAETSAAVVLLAFTSLLELMGGHRALTPDERKEAEKIFGVSIDLDRVKVATASVAADVINYINGNRPFTTMYIINFGSKAVVDKATLIHELTHVWQGVQQGPLYMTRALEAQIGAGVSELFHHGHYDDSAAYAVTDQELIDNQGVLSKFNPEEQASIVEHYWIQKFSGSPLSSLPTVAQLEPYAKAVFKPKKPTVSASVLTQPVLHGTLSPVGFKLPRAAKKVARKRAA